MKPDSFGQYGTTGIARINQKHALPVTHVGSTVVRGARLIAKLDRDEEDRSSCRLQALPKGPEMPAKGLVCRSPPPVAKPAAHWPEPRSSVALNHHLAERDLSGIGNSDAQIRGGLDVCRRPPFVGQ